MVFENVLRVELCCVWIRGTMSIRKFFKPVDGLPDPRGSLSSSMPSAAIASANREVEKVVEATKKEKKSGPYKKYIYTTSFGFFHDSIFQVHSRRVSRNRQVCQTPWLSSSNCLLFKKVWHQDKFVIGRFDEESLHRLR